jgi:hypothetical protein
MAQISITELCKLSDKLQDDWRSLKVQSETEKDEIEIQIDNVCLAIKHIEQNYAESHCQTIDLTEFDNAFDKCNERIQKFINKRKAIFVKEIIL